MARLHELLQEIAAMPSDPEGEPWSLYLGLHPDRSGVRVWRMTWTEITDVATLTDLPG